MQSPHFVDVVKKICTSSSSKTSRFYKVMTTPSIKSLNSGTFFGFVKVIFGRFLKRLVVSFSVRRSASPIDKAKHLGRLIYLTQSYYELSALDNADPKTEERYQALTHPTPRRLKLAAYM